MSHLGMNEYGMFDSKDVKPADPKALVLAEALIDLIVTKKNFDEKKRVVMNKGYWGQYSPEDFYARWEEAYNRAADAYAEAVKNLFPTP